MEDTHQGYTNYATFGVVVTLENDRPSREQVDYIVTGVLDQAPAANQVREGIWTEDQFIRFELADRIRDYTERLCEAGNPSLMASQMVQAGLSEVDWEDVADSFLSD